MDAHQFIAKWRSVKLTERSASQQHFLDLCELVEHPKPADVDKTGDSFTFERGAAKRGGGDGWADVWKKAFFGWEYKGKHKDLAAAYDQLLQYREDLESPPLLVTCDMDRIVIHTNFTATPVAVYEIRLEDLAAPENLERVRNLFHNPERLRPGVTCEHITSQAAGKLADVAQSLRSRGLNPHAVAHFLDRIVFCLFAEDIKLLPEGLFTEVLQWTKDKPERFTEYLAALFDAMAKGGDFLLRDIRHFNGSLFDSTAVLALTAAELALVHDVAKLDWSAIDPSVLGTLFERGMDPGKRSQLGAHYTSRQDIETLVEPVVMAPLRREWQDVKTAAEALLTTGKRAPGPPVTLSPAKLRKARLDATLLVGHFHQRLAAVKVLDPACGSGNFLYVTLQKLKDLEKEVIVFSQDRLQESFFPLVGPWQLYGIEVNPYAHDLAQMTAWIGYLQWTRANGFGVTQDPVLKPMSGNFQCRDAILDLSDPAHPTEPDWPAVDFIVGNPPFLGGNRVRQELGDRYIETVFEVYRDRVPAFADLCCYWFEKARAHIGQGDCRRAGLLATQGIRGGANRKVLERIKATGDIFFAESDRPWILDGANVHVSMVGFDDGAEVSRMLDGSSLETINADLSSATNITVALRLPVNTGYCFMGPSAKAPFDIPGEVATDMLLRGGNPHGRPNSDVIRRVASAIDLTRGDRGVWTVDFGLTDEGVASLYQAPFEYVKEHVLPVRSKGKSQTNLAWWQYERPRVEMRLGLAPLSRFAATPGVAKHRLFAWRSMETLCNQGTIVFARSDDYFFGVLHSRLHEVWALAQGTQLREKESGFRYTPTTCFETFPFPWDPGQEPAADPLAIEIGAAAAQLCRLRDAWLNPPEWTREEVLEFPGSVGGPWARFVHDPDARGIGTVRWPRTVPKDPSCAQKLAKRTLTNLYNQRPTWLDLAHRRLDEAVCAAYSATTGGEWHADMPADAILANLLALNFVRAAG